MLTAALIGQALIAGGLPALFAQKLMALILALILWKKLNVLNRAIWFFLTVPAGLMSAYISVLAG